VRLTVADLPGVLLWALPLVPLLAALTAAAIPSNDRLTLRALGVGALVAALLAGVVAVGMGRSSIATGALVAPGLWPVLAAVPPLALAPIAVLPLLTVLVALPIALRAGAPRVQEGTAAYVVICLAEGVAVTGALLVVDVVDAVAAALVAAVPGFALVALFGGPERGTVTWRAASLWLVVDGLALAVLAGHASAAQLGVPREWLTLVVLGPGLVRLAAGPWGLWALPLFEMAPVTGAMSAAAVSFPLGAVLLWRAAQVVGAPGLSAVAPVVSALLAGSILVGGVLVTMERDLRRIAAHWVGVIGSIAALGLLAAVASGRAATDAVALACLGGLAIGLLLIVVEAIERRLETRRIIQLGGLFGAAPLLAALLPLSMMAVAGVPGPGSARALWPTLGGILAASPAFAWGGLAAVVGVLMGWIGCAVAVARVVQPQTRKHGQFIRVSFRQGIRLMVPVAALVALSALSGPLASLVSP
jgi:NADH:ubiquinone oxidoreductase subunit 4 (subunit M)